MVTAMSSQGENVSPVHHHYLGHDQERTIKGLCPLTIPTFATWQKVKMKTS